MGNYTVKRYDQLLHLLRLFKPKTIMEIGTWNGIRATILCEEMLKHHQSISYIGFDLFEEATAETDAEELNVKQHYNVDDVKKYILTTVPDNRVDVTLYKGNTRETLNKSLVQKHNPDFIFIDGGHSVETIQHDYDSTNVGCVRVFDDWYEPDENNRGPDTDKYGCNRVLIQHQFSTLTAFRVLPESDPVKDGGRVYMALVL